LLWLFLALGAVVVYTTNQRLLLNLLPKPLNFTHGVCQSVFEGGNGFIYVTVLCVMYFHNVQRIKRQLHCFFVSHFPQLLHLVSIVKTGRLQYTQ
jgi:hypothetical protein